MKIKLSTPGGVWGEKFILKDIDGWILGINVLPDIVGNADRLKIEISDSSQLLVEFMFACKQVGCTFYIPAVHPFYNSGEDLFFRVGANTKLDINIEPMIYQPWESFVSLNVGPK